MLLKLAWRNVWRNRQRTIITSASVFFAVILSVVTSSLQTGVFDNLVRNVVSFYTGYIQIHKAGYWEEQLIDNSFAYENELKEKLKSFPKITGSAPRLESFGLGSCGDITKGLMIIGTDPENEDRLTGLRDKIILGEYFNADDKMVMISEGLAEKFRVTVKDTIVLLSQGYHGSIASGKYLIKGIVKFGSPDLNERTIYLPLKEVQSMFSAENMLTSLILFFEDPEDMNEVKSELMSLTGRKYEVMTWEEMLPEISQHIQTDKAGFQIVAGILYLIISFGIFGTILMMISERDHEFGVLISVGMKKIKLGSVVVMEIIYITFMGVIAGAMASIPLIYYLAYNPIRLSGEIADVYEQFGFEAIFPASTDISHVTDQIIIVWLISFVISLYPFLKIIFMNPLRSMQK